MLTYWSLNLTLGSQTHEVDDEPSESILKTPRTARKRSKKTFLFTCYSPCLVLLLTSREPTWTVNRGSDRGRRASPTTHTVYLVHGDSNARHSHMTRDTTSSIFKTEAPESSTAPLDVLEVQTVSSITPTVLAIIPYAARWLDFTNLLLQLALLTFWV